MGSAEIVVDLSRSGTVQLIRRLDLHHQFFIDDHVEALSNDLLAFVVDWDEHLSSYRMSTCAQLPFERRYIHLLEKPESKGIVHLIKPPNHGMG